MCSMSAAEQKSVFRKTLRSRTVLLSTGIFLTAALLNCIVPADDDVPRFTFSITGTISGDTIAPYGTIALALTDPIDDSAEASFSFSPAATGYYVTYNRTRDTVTVVLTDPLECRTRYSIHPGTTLQSKNGTTMSPETDSVTFFTYACEQEPNNTTISADTFNGRLFGSISTVVDTDVFILSSKASAVAITSYGTSTAIFLSQGGSRITEKPEFKDHDTVDIPSEVTLPVYVNTCAFGKSVGGYYEIDLIVK